MRVIRGGSFGGDPVNLWVEYRDSHPSDGAREFVDFPLREVTADREVGQIIDVICVLPSIDYSEAARGSARGSAPRERGLHVLEFPEISQGLDPNFRTPF
jgi:hypothetical protein